MDATIFKKILERRLALQAELIEIDSFIRQADALAARLFPPAHNSTEHRLTTIEPANEEQERDNIPFSFSPLPGRLRTD